MRTESRELVPAAIAGDSAALELLWHEHLAWITSVLLCHAPAGSDLDDLAQEVALRLVREIRRLEQPAAFRGWLRVIALNVARDSGRQASRSARRLAIDGREPVDPVSERTCDPAHERLERAFDIIEGLPPTYREPLLLKSVHGWSQRRIAKTLGIPETAVESRLARARRMLRAELRRPDQPRTASQELRMRCTR